MKGKEEFHRRMRLRETCSPLRAQQTTMRGPGHGPHSFWPGPRQSLDRREEPPTLSTSPAARTANAHGAGSGELNGFAAAAAQQQAPTWLLPPGEDARSTARLASAMKSLQQLFEGVLETGRSDTAVMTLLGCRATCALESLAFQTSQLAAAVTALEANGRSYRAEVEGLRNAIHKNKPHKCDAPAGPSTGDAPTDLSSSTPTEKTFAYCDPASKDDNYCTRVEGMLSQILGSVELCKQNTDQALAMAIQSAEGRARLTELTAKLWADIKQVAGASPLQLATPQPTARAWSGGDESASTEQRHPIPSPEQYTTVGDVQSTPDAYQASEPTAGHDDAPPSPAPLTSNGPVDPISNSSIPNVESVAESAPPKNIPADAIQQQALERSVSQIAPLAKNDGSGGTLASLPAPIAEAEDIDVDMHKKTREPSSDDLEPDHVLIGGHASTESPPTMEPLTSKDAGGGDDTNAQERALLMMKRLNETSWTY